VWLSPKNVLCENATLRFGQYVGFWYDIGYAIYDFFFFSAAKKEKSYLNLIR
jgi:hypothetical protein